MTRYLFIVISLLSTLQSYGQSPSASFTIPLAGCINQSIELTNTSTNADLYSWDFCLDDFSTLKSSADITTLPSLASGFAYRLIHANNQWIGFATSRDNNLLYRLDFGISPENTPTVVNLGNPGGKLYLPEGIDIIQSNGNWYGFVGSLEFSTAAQGIIRLDFGTSLQNTPVAINLGNYGTSTRFRDLKVIQQGANLALFLMNYNGNSILRIDFRNSFDNTVDASNMLNIALTNASLPMGIDFVKSGSNWIAHVASLANNKIIQLNFGTDILSTPTEEAGYTFAGVTRPYKVKMIIEGDKYYSIIANESLALSIIDFQDLKIASTPSIVSVSGLPNLIGIDGVRINGKAMIQGISSISTGLKKLIFQTTCSANMDVSTLQTPVSLSYTIGGSKRIELVSTKSSTGEQSITGGIITISSSSAPDISFSTTGICSGNPTAFTTTSMAGGIVSYSWDFGDLSLGAGSTTSHGYAAGTFAPRLDITGSNGCQNYFKSTITIYSQPIPDFTLPPSPICTGNIYSITNTTVDTFNGNLSYNWMVNNVLIETSQYLNYTFTTGGAYDIKLITSIPGCSTELTKNISEVKDGPLIDFASNGNCENTLVEFTNTTTDPVVSFLWDFGNGQTSIAQNMASTTYSTIGSYVVSLRGNSANGCQNTKTKSLKIYSRPMPDFSLSLPPFSCSGSDSQFNDLTPNPTDSFLSSWQWNFNDPASTQNTGTGRFPRHIFDNAGRYTISFTVTTNFGCSATLQKQVIIQQSPIAGFTNNPACKGQAVTFTDASGNDIQSWYWQIDANTYFFSKPIHIFTAPGDHPVELTVVSSNNCISYIKKIINVPPIITPNFTVQKNCNLQNTIFTDVTPQALDPVSLREWEFGTLGKGSNSPTLFTFPTTGDFNVTLNVTTQAGCTYSIEKNINIIPTPVASFTATPEEGVPPLTVKFNNTSLNASDYLWNFIDKNIATSQLVSPSYIFEEYGDNVVDLTAKNAQGCSSTVTKIIKTLLPLKDIAVVALTPVKNEDGSLKILAALKNTGNIAVGDFSITLDISGFTSIREKVVGSIAVNTVTNHVFTYEISNSSRLDFLCAEIALEGDNNVENNRKCASLSDQIVVLESYPNPVNDVLHIDLITNKAQPVLLTIVDALGKYVFTTSQDAVQGENNFEVMLQNVSSGVYILILNAGYYNKSQRVMISH